MIVIKILTYKIIMLFYYLRVFVLYSVGLSIKDNLFIFFKQIFKIKYLMMYTSNIKIPTTKKARLISDKLLF